MRLFDESNNIIPHTLYTFGYMNKKDNHTDHIYPNKVYPTKDRLGSWHTYVHGDSRTLHERNDYFLGSGFVLVPVNNETDVKKIMITGVRAQRIPNVKVEYKDSITDVIEANDHETSGHDWWLDHMQSVITVNVNIDEFPSNGVSLSYEVEQTNQHKWCDGL
tara:strand:+ start:100 stop:585 length:486 start_codon:yes stop_codon:yes gene_type:complete